MKKIIIFMVACFLATNANANHIGIYLGQSTIADPHIHRIAHDAENRANLALFVAVGAVALATVGIIVGIEASQNNIGQVQIARF